MADTAQHPRLHLIPDRQTALLVALLFPLTLALGNWQLDRAVEKQQLLETLTARQIAAPVDLPALRAENLTGDDLRFRKVRLRGHFDNAHYWLLDNRLQHGKFGYEVVSPFQLVDGSIVLINRGWLAGSQRRELLPAVAAMEGEVELVAEIYVPPGEPFQLAALNGEGWPRVVQELSMDAAATALGAAPFPYLLRLKAAEPGALTPNWVAINVSPDKHRAYAAQWFAMAVALLIFLATRCSNVLAWLKTRRRDTH